MLESRARTKNWLGWEGGKWISGWGPTFRFWIFFGCGIGIEGEGTMGSWVHGCSGEGRGG